MQFFLKKYLNFRFKLSPHLVLLVAIFYLIFAPQSQADDWDNLYNKYQGKFFIISWTQQAYFTNGAVNPKQDFEFGYSIISNNSIRRIVRNTNKVTGQAGAPLDFIDTKGTTKYWNGNSSEVIDISGNKITNTFYKNGSQSSIFQLTVLGNSCRAKIVEEDTSLYQIDHYQRSAFLCKIIDQ